MSYPRLRETLRRGRRARAGWAMKDKRTLTRYPEDVARTHFIASFHPDSFGIPGQISFITSSASLCVPGMTPIKIGADYFIG